MLLPSPGRDIGAHGNRRRPLTSEGLRFYSISGSRSGSVRGALRPWSSVRLRPSGTPRTCTSPSARSAAARPRPHLRSVGLRRGWLRRRVDAAAQPGRVPRLAVPTTGARRRRPACDDYQLPRPRPRDATCRRAVRVRRRVPSGGVRSSSSWRARSWDRRHRPGDLVPDDRKTSPPAAPDVPKLFQPIAGGADETFLEQVGRAEAAGYIGLVVTVDTSMPGWRERSMERRWNPDPSLLLANFGGDIAKLGGVLDFSRRTWTWEHLGELCSSVSIPWLAKGVLVADDASRPSMPGRPACSSPTTVAANSTARRAPSTPCRRSSRRSARRDRRDRRWHSARQRRREGSGVGCGRRGGRTARRVGSRRGRCERCAPGAGPAAAGARHDDVTVRARVDLRHQPSARRAVAGSGRHQPCSTS